jgi:hypothetical protein
MTDVYINDNALFNFERFGVADAYSMRFGSVKLVSQTGQLRMS